MWLIYCIHFSEGQKVLELGCGAGLPGVLAFTRGATGKYLEIGSTPPPLPVSLVLVLQRHNYLLSLTIPGLNQLSIQGQRRGMGLTRVKVTDVISE